MIQGKDPNEGYQTNEQVEEDELPMPTYENLQQIVDELSTATSDILRKRKISAFIMQESVSSYQPFLIINSPTRL